MGLGHATEEGGSQGERVSVEATQWDGGGCWTSDAPQASLWA